MGNVVPTGRASGEARDLVAGFEGSAYGFQETLGNGKFLKSVRAQSNGNLVIVKVYEKIPGATDQKALQKLKKELGEIRRAFQPQLHPNVVPYNRWGESDKACFLVRQYVTNNLLDRQNMRPFLSTMEKRWIAFQLLKSLAQCHSANVVHGDIKAENFLVTSWNWVLLSDFAPFKPTFLPLDDTAPFNYFFASSSNRDCCCVAPERFCSPTSIIDISLLDSAPPQCSSVLSVMMDTNVSAGDADHFISESAKVNADSASSSSPTSPRSVRRQRSYSFSSSNRSTCLRPSMDIFSLGCVIMELFQDAEPCFGLAELLKYAKRDSENQVYLTNKLNKLKFAKVRPLVQHMLGDDPARRLSAEAYLNDHSGPGQLFPPYFGEFLHPFLARFLSPEFDLPDERIWVICENYATILQHLCGATDEHGTRYFTARYEEWFHRNSITSDSVTTSNEHFRADATGVVDLQYTSTTSSGSSDMDQCDELLGETASILEQMKDLRTSTEIQTILETAGRSIQSQLKTLGHNTNRNAKPEKKEKEGYSDDNNLDEMEENVPSTTTMDADDNGSMIVLSMICSTVRFVRFPSTKVIALRLLQRLSRYTDDETRLQRIVPYVVVLLSDSSSMVRCTALRVLTELLRQINSLPLSDRRIFPEYLFPAVARFKTDASFNCRLALAECLPKLAETSARFLELYRVEQQKRMRDSINTAGKVLAAPSQSNSVVKKTSMAKVTEGIVPGNFDADREELQNIVQDFVNNMVEQPSVVRRTLLCDITRLCLFFGRERTSGHILPIIITFLNERDDWQLRATFFEHIPGVSALVGPLALQQFLLPCIIQALQDVEEIVIEKTLACLFALVTLGLLDSTMMAELTAKVVPLVYHPSAWIRRSVIRLLAALVSSSRFGIVEVQVTIVRLLIPVLREDALENAVLLGYKKDIETNEALITEMLLDPLDRRVFTGAMGKLEREILNASPSSANSQSSGSRPSSLKRSSSKSNLNSWLKLSHRKADEESSPREDVRSVKKQPPNVVQSQGVDSSNNNEDGNSLDLEKISKSDKSKLAAIESYLRAAVGARRGDRSKPSFAASELPAEYTQNIAKQVQLYSIVVPDQRTVTLAINNNYSEFLNLASSSMAPGSFLLHQHATFKDLVNKYGIIFRSRRFGGGHGINTSEAISSGETRLLHRIQALEVPPLPPDMGTLRKLEDGAAFVGIIRRPSQELGSLVESGEGKRAPTTRDAASTPIDKPWRPRGVLAANLYGHDSAVNKICTAQDSLFFATGSDDGTVRLWLTVGLEDGYGVRPKLTYASQGGSITDLCMIENTHSIASTSTAGSVHVFKIERACELSRQSIDPNNSLIPTSVGTTTAQFPSIPDYKEDLLLDRSETRRMHATNALQAQGTPGKRRDDFSSNSSGQAGSTSLRHNLASSTVLELDLQQEGAIRSICHFPTSTQSLLAFACDSGSIYGWDLRTRSRAWCLRVGPQVGCITCLAVPPEGAALWLVAGTSRGVILVFDLRFQVLLCAWRHSSHRRINRLYISRATCSDPFVFVAAGSNQFGLFNLSNGNAEHSFRSVPTDMPVEEAMRVGSLEPLDISTLAPLSGIGRQSRHSLKGGVDYSTGLWKNLGLDDLKGSNAETDHTVRALLCPFDTMGTKQFQSHIPTTIISAGTDRRIRYWNSDMTLSYSVFDQEFGTGVKQFWDTSGKVSVCREDITGHTSPLTHVEGRGLPSPSTNHEDAILDLAFVNPYSSFQNSSGFLLSASRDGVVKAWV